MEGVVLVLLILSIISYVIHRWFKIKKAWIKVAILNQGTGYMQGLTDAHKIYQQHGDDPDRFDKEIAIKVRKANDYYGQYLSEDQRPSSFQEVS